MEENTTVLEETDTVRLVNQVKVIQPSNYKVLIGLENLDRKLY